MIAAKELCAHCLHHSGLDTAEVRECTKKNTRPHWLSSEARDPCAPTCTERKLPPVEQRAGRVVYACGTNIRVKAVSDSHADSYSAELATLFSTK